MKRLIISTGAVAVTFAAATVWIDTDVSPTTPRVVLAAGIGFGLLAITQLAATQHWTWRAVGLLLMQTGVAVLLLGSWWALRHGLSDGVDEVLSDLVLALWVVGVPLSILGTALYWWPRVRDGAVAAWRADER